MSRSGTYQQTPRLEVRTGRGVAIRTVNYRRTLAGDPAEVQVARQCYSPSGQLLSQIDPRLFARAQAGATIAPNFRYRHSLSGRALRIEGVDNGLRLDLSDVLGRPHWSGDGRGMPQRWQYDALGRPLTRFERDAAGVERCRERFDYGEAAEPAAGNNLRGQLWRHWDPAGERLVPGYSLQGQPLAEQRRFLLALEEPDWPVDEAAGEQLLEAEVAVTRWGYDALGEPLSQLDAAGHRRRSAFNRAGQLAGRWLTPAGQAETRVQGELDYNALGQLTTEWAGNGVRTTRAYDPATQRLLRLTTRRQPDNRLLQDLHYDYDPVGNVLRIEDASQAVRHFRNQRIEAVSRYAYDSLYRLIEACGREAANAGQQGASLPPLQPLGDGSQVVNYRRTYRYDVADNLLSVQHQGAQSYRLDMTVSEHSNRVSRSQAGLTAGDVEGGFDPNGNLRELQPGQALQWEAHNQLSRVRLLARESAPDDEERYGYDGARQRVRKRRTLYGGNQTQVQETRYLPGLELHRSWQTDGGGQGRQTTEAYQVVSDGTVRWLHWEAGLPGGLSNDRYRYSLDDHLGSSALETDDQGQLLSREEYYPFGGTALWAGRSEVEANYKTLRYSGKERDATGLYYYGYRYYAPWLQRWLNPDPAGTVDGLNLYRMVRNDPLSNIDSYGLDSSGVNFTAMEIGVTLIIGVLSALLYLVFRPRERYDKPFNSSEIEAWRELPKGMYVKLPEGQYIVHAIRHDDSMLYRRRAEEVFSEWDVISASLVDVNSIKAGSNGERETGLLSSVGLILDVPAQNIIGAHPYDAEFNTHAARVDPTKEYTKEELHALGYKLADEVLQSSPANSSGRYINTVNPPEKLLSGRNRHPVGRNYNEVLLVGRPDVNIYSTDINVKSVVLGENKKNRKGLTGEIGVSGILVIPRNPNDSVASNNNDSRAKQLKSVNKELRLYKVP